MRRALMLCRAENRTLQVVLSSLFLSTQSKRRQLNARLHELDHNVAFWNHVEHFLCPKCGAWIPDYKFEQRLPLRELLRFY